MADQKRQVGWGPAQGRVQIAEQRCLGARPVSRFGHVGATQQINQHNLTLCAGEGALCVLGDPASLAVHRGRRAGEPDNTSAARRGSSPSS